MLQDKGFGANISKTGLIGAESNSHLHFSSKYMHNVNNQRTLPRTDETQGHSDPPYKTTPVQTVHLKNRFYAPDSPQSAILFWLWRNFIFFERN